MINEAWSPDADRILIEQAAEIGRRLLWLGTSLAVAESVTGGWIGRILTAVPGSSKWFYGAIVSYQVAAKSRWLGVPQDLLAKDGAVSEATARWMLRGVLAQSTASWAVATTGYAGPQEDDSDGRDSHRGDADPDPLTGLVFVGWARRPADSPLEEIREFRFSGSREAIRHQVVEQALTGLLEHLRV